MLQVMQAQLGLNDLVREKGRMDFALEEAARAAEIILERDPENREEAENAGRRIFVSNFGKTDAELAFIYGPETKVMAKWRKFCSESCFWS